MFLMLFVTFTAAQESAGKQKPLRSGFYFDLSIGGAIRHLEAKHHEYDNNQYLSYTGKGGHISARLGGIIRGTVAIYENIKLEITSGENSGGRYTIIEKLYGS